MSSSNSIVRRCVIVAAAIGWFGQLQVMADVNEVGEKGSLLIYPEVELRWDASGNLIQDTFIELTNDYPASVNTLVYFVHADGLLEAVPPERFHPGWHWVDTEIPLTQNQSVYWSASTGSPSSIAPFTILDPGMPPGRPAADGTGDRVLRGSIVVWASTGWMGYSIRWNHLVGEATIVNYRDRTAWQYGAYSSRFVDPSVAHGDFIGEEGIIRFDGLKYEAFPDELVLDFFASGSSILSSDNQAVVADTSLILLSPMMDLQQETVGPSITKAEFDIWNMNGVRFSGVSRCITNRDKQLLSSYESPNYFTLSMLGTDKGKARINGVADSVCGDDTVSSPLLGLARKLMTYDLTSAVSCGGTRLSGFGEDETTRILFDPAPLPPPDKIVHRVVDSDTLRWDALAKRGTDESNNIQSLTKSQVDNYGSLLVIPNIELAWDSEGNLIKDTIVEFSNNFDEQVTVQVYLVNADSELPATAGERYHPGSNKVSSTVTLSANQPAFWSAFKGMVGDVLPFTALDPGYLPGRPSDDGSGNRYLRGFAYIWAVDAEGQEIRWDYLTGAVTIINYADKSSWVYSPIAFSINADNTPHGQRSGTPGVLNLDGMEYESCPGELLMEFIASESSALSSQGGTSTVFTNTRLTLLPASLDSVGTIADFATTKASFDIWNTNEVKLSNTQRCISGWDQQDIGLYDAPNAFLLSNLGTDHGKARIDGISDQDCGDETQNMALFGVAMRLLNFDYGSDVARSGSRLPGMGTEDAAIYVASDCNSNGVLDTSDILGGTSADCNQNGYPDECELAESPGIDCNLNGVPDDCDIQRDHDCCFGNHGASCSDEGIADCVCQVDPYCCDTDWDRLCVALVLESECGFCPSEDSNHNSVPDECDPDCNTNGIPDFLDISEGASADCNTNSIPDECDIALGTSKDINRNSIPDKCESNRTWYVDDDAPPGGDGQSWDTAYTYFQDALHACIPGDVIHVAGGTYRPDQDERGLVTRGDCEATFNLINAVELYGGFAGYGSMDQDSRDIAAHASVLSGDLSGNDNPEFLGDLLACYTLESEPLEPECEPYDISGDQEVNWLDLDIYTRTENVSENSANVVTADTVESAAVLSGFTVSSGNAFTGASGAGGGLFIHDSDLTVSDCTFCGNSADWGGGIAVSGSGIATLSNCIFSNNWASRGGGAGVVDSNSRFDKCTFTRNAAILGGGVFTSSWFSSQHDPQLRDFSDCYFDSNIAQAGGGGLADELADLSDIAYSSKETGDSTSIQYYLRLTNCLFARNEVLFGDEDFGGSGFFHSYVPPPPRIQSLVADTAPVHRASRELRWYPYAPLLTNCTFTGNEIKGDAVGGILACGNLKMINCIIWGNRNKSGFGENAQLDVALGSISYCCIQGLDGYSGNRNTGANPLFADADGPDGIPGTIDDDFRLQPGSPCRNTGDNAGIPEGVTTDLDGLPRLRGCFVDMGAYEYQDDKLIGDVNDDCDVDLDDYYDFNFCLERFGYEKNPILDACLKSFDFDMDGRIDLVDFARFQVAFEH